MGVHVFPHPESPSHLPPHPIPQGHPSAPALSTLSHALNLDWWSVSHMVIYMFQCYSLKSSHPRPLPQSRKVCSLHLCLSCWLAYKVIITIFLPLLLLSRFSCVWLCAIPETAGHQASPSLGFSRQEHWSGLPFPSPMQESEKWKWSRSVVSDCSDPMDCSLPGSSVHGSFQARVLE